MAGGEDPRAVTVVQVAAGEAHTLALTGVICLLEVDGIGYLLRRVEALVKNLRTDGWVIDVKVFSSSGEFPSGSVYGWGRGLGHLGAGVGQDELAPTLIEIVLPSEDDEISSQSSQSGKTREESMQRDYRQAQKSTITQIAAGAYHSLALAGDGTMFSWGFNACQLGRDQGASYPAPIVFPEESSGKALKIVLVEAGSMISCAVDQEGGLWLWGAVPPPTAHANANNTFNFANIQRPERVHGLFGQKVCRVACGTEHILALVEAKGDSVDCYVWGSNSYGQLGLGNIEPHAIPTFNPFFTSSQAGAVVDLACGAFHSAIVTLTGDEASDLGPEPVSSPMLRKMQQSPQLLAQVTASPKLRGYAHDQQYIEAMASSKVYPRPSDRHPGYPYPGASNGNHSGYSFHSDASTSPKLSSRGSSQVSMTGMGVRVPGKEEGGRVSICWTFGQGENGQLGHGSTANSAVPNPVERLPAQERIQAVVCGLFHMGVVLETGDVWVWGMEGGLGACPGIGPPGSRSGDTLIPVRVFGESSAECHPMTGCKGIACGAAHTVTVSNGGRDIWAWGRGQSGVLGLGHASDSWFPCPVVWPPGSIVSKEVPHVEEAPPFHELPRKSHRASSRAGSKGRVDEIKSFLREVEELKPRRGDRKPVDFTRSPARRSEGDYRLPQHLQDYEESRASFATETGMETASRLSVSTSYGDLHSQSNDVSALKAELARCRRYTETLHAAIYGGLEAFAYQLPRDNMYTDDSGDGRSSHQGRTNAIDAKILTLQDWQRCLEVAPDQDLVKLEHFYKSMRNQLKDVLFQRRMEDWCRRCMSSLSTSAYHEPPPVRDPYSAPSTPSLPGPTELALRMSGIMTDRGEALPPAALAASIAEFKLRSQNCR